MLTRSKAENIVGRPSLAVVRSPGADSRQGCDCDLFQLRDRRAGVARLLASLAVIQRTWRQKGTARATQWRHNAACGARLIWEVEKAPTHLWVTWARDNPDLVCWEGI